jgi:hypothetical protein
MEFTVDIPQKYADKLAEVEELDPSIRDQIEVETLPHVLRLINEAHRQLEGQEGAPQE